MSRARLTAAVVIFLLAACGEGDLTVDGELQGSDSAALTVSGLQYFPLPVPFRLVDTRPGSVSQNARKTPLAAGEVFVVPGRNLTFGGATVPARAAALVGNVTVVPADGGAGGFLTVFSQDPRPNTSTLNFAAGEVIPNAFTTTLGTDGALRVFASSAAHVVVDVTGFYAPPGTGGLFFHPLPQPVRLLDTRPAHSAVVTPQAPLAANGTLALSAAAVVPASAVALLGNGTVVNGADSPGGFISLFPTGAARPISSNLNFAAGSVRANAFTVKLTGGAFSVFSTAQTDFIVDVVGYYSPDATDALTGAGLVFNAFSSPIRLFDSRPGAAAFFRPGAPLSAGAPRSVLASNLLISGTLLPRDAVAVQGSVVAANGGQAAGGFLTVFPAAAAAPNVSTVNYEAGGTRSNAFTVKLAGGSLGLRSSNATHAIVDVTGFFRAPGATGCLSVSPAQELVINALGVVEDKTRTTGAGPWTFQFLMSQLAGTQNLTSFTKAWLNTFDAAQSVNGDAMPRRPQLRGAVLTPWETASGGAAAPLDFSKAPFRLLAITNRMDLRPGGTTVTNAGEGRFIFGVLGAGGVPLQFTVIFEYKLPARSAADVQRWAERWHKLGALPAGSAQYNEELEAITRAFSSGGLVAGTFNGSSISQVRTNEIVGDGFWQLREFHLTALGALAPATVVQSPRNELNGSAALARFINANSAQILAQTHVVPASFEGAPFLGAESDETFTWNAAGITNPAARHLFALNTCNGCHLSETGTSFTHISPRSAGQVAALSRFLTGGTVSDPISGGTTHTFNDLAFRQTALQQLLCSPAGAATPLTSSSRVH